jgi:hypothetical protein
MEQEPSMSSIPSANKTLPRHGRKKYSGSGKVTATAATHDWNGWWSGTLRKRYGDHKSAHKAVAGIASCGIRTVRLWFAGETVPQVRYMSMLLAADDEIFNEYMEAIGRADQARRMMALKHLSAAADLLAEGRQGEANNRS